MKQTKKFWIALGTGVAIFFLIILISDIIETGERIRKLHPYLEKSIIRIGLKIKK